VAPRHTERLSDGANPYAPLVLGEVGNFYGTTFNGGTDGYGVVFKITAAGALTVLHSFTPSTDGATPYGGRVQATDGNFYGAAYQGGSKNHGTIYRIQPAELFRRCTTLMGPAAVLAGYPMATHDRHPLRRYQHRRHSQHGCVLPSEGEPDSVRRAASEFRQGGEVHRHSGPGIQRRKGSLFQRHGGKV
jgi:uncharacterized repeat protein (TIGR03803 family)